MTARAKEQRAWQWRKGSETCTYYGTNLDRLMHVKARYDTGVFLQRSFLGDEREQSRRD
ncbi:MAG: BBE domain-containing protein [Rubrobacteraceae bacterium]